MHFLHSMYSYGIPVFHKARWSVIQAWLGTTVQRSSTASVSVIFSFFPLYTVGKTIFLWVSLSSPHKQNGTIQWGTKKKLIQCNQQEPCPKYSTFYTKVAFKKYSQARLVGIAVT